MGAFGLKSGADGNEPVRATVFPEDDAARSRYPMADGLLDYFPNALAAVAEVSKVGSEKHNAGQPMHWARGKSIDHANKIIRHLADRGAKDASGIRHSAYAAWRVLALLQTELEEAGECPPSRASRFPEVLPTHEDMTMPELRQPKVGATSRKSLVLLSSQHDLSGIRQGVPYEVVSEASAHGVFSYGFVDDHGDERHRTFDAIGQTFVMGEEWEVVHG